MSIFTKKKTKNEPAVANTPVVTEQQQAKPATTHHPLHAESLIIKPLITEKAMRLSEKNTYVFLVNTFANKTEVKKELENLYSVDITKITMAAFGQKPRTFRGKVSSSRPIKKAMVTVKEGQKIEIYNK